MTFFKRFTILILLLLSLFCPKLNAEVWTPETLPMVHLQDSLRFVCNPDGVLSTEAVRATDAILANLKLKKGIETVVVVVKRIKGADAYQFGMDLSRKYGIGDKVQRTGLIIILSTEDRKYYFLTGNGLEGTLPDGLCYQIQQKVFVPALKKGNWDQAIYASVEAVNGVIMGDETITRRYKESDDTGDTMLGLILAFSFFAFMLVIYHSSNKAKHTCPRCKTKGSFDLVCSHRIRRGNRWYTQSTWRCKQCGHTEIKETDDTHNDNTGAGAFVPPIFMSSGRGFGGGGGGFSGGSFGGGSFGGGGAGGDF